MSIVVVGGEREEVVVVVSKRGMRTSSAIWRTDSGVANAEPSQKAELVVVFSLEG
jgi:phage gp45-like